jgi:hypothetical protein
MTAVAYDCLEPRSAASSRVRRSRRARPGIAALAICWLRVAPVAAAPADASPATRAIAIEAHATQRSPAAAQLIAPVLDELDRAGFAARPAAIAPRFDAPVPRPGALDADATAASLIQLVSRGRDAFLAGSYEDARSTLQQASERLARNPARCAGDAAVQRAWFDALVSLAHSHARLGSTAASAAAMADVVRLFPDQPVTRARYGPEAEQAYRAAQWRGDALGRGQLAVRVDDPRAVIYVDCALRGTGSAALDRMVPGPHRVFVRTPDGTGRQYALELRAGEHRELEIAWPLDASLVVADTWIGLVLANDAERARWPAYAALLARRAHSELVAFVGTTRGEDQTALVALLADAQGQIVRSGLAVPGGEGDEHAARALARFIADGTLAPGIRVLAGAERSPRPEPRRVAATLFVAGGVVATAAGAILLAVDQDDGRRVNGALAPSFRDTAPWGAAIGAAGLAAVGVGAWLLLHRESGAAPVVSLQRSGAVLGWAGTF